MSDALNAIFASLSQSREAEGIRIAVPAIIDPSLFELAQTPAEGASATPVLPPAGTSDFTE